MVREVAHALKRNPLSDLNKSLQFGRYPRHNHLRKFWWRSVKGLWVAGDQSLPFSIDFDRRPYKLQHYRASVWSWLNYVCYYCSRGRLLDLTYYIRNMQ